MNFRKFGVSLFLVIMLLPNIALFSQTNAVQNTADLASDSAAIKYCQKCGTKLNMDAQFCSKCGMNQNQVVQNPSQGDYTGDSALKFLEEKLMYMLLVSMNDFNTELAKVMVEISKIAQLAIATGEPDCYKPEFTSPVLASVLVFGGLLPELFKVNTGGYSDLLPGTPLDAGLMKGLDGGANSMAYLVSLTNSVFHCLKTKHEFFKQFKICKGLGKLYSAKEIKEKEGRRTKARHVEFSFSYDISKFSKLFVFTIGKPNNSKSLPFSEAIIDKTDFNGNKVILKNIGVYGTGILHIVIGLQE